LAAERDDLMKANALLHALIGNREAEIERLKATLQAQLLAGLEQKYDEATKEEA
jgi:hypothetical protein